MKHANKRMAAFVLFMLSVLTVSAQMKIDTVQVMLRCQQRVGELNSYIEQMANKQRSEASVKDVKKTALSLFINDGKPYVEIVERKNGSRETIKKDGTIVEVSKLVSVKDKRTGRYKLDTQVTPKKTGDYFDGIIKLPYTAVRVETTDIKDMQIGDMYQLDNGKWVMTVYFDQKFYGEMKDGKFYCDITHKYVVCYIDIVKDMKTGQDAFYVRLGDVKVDSTERYK